MLFLIYVSYYVFMLFLGCMCFNLEDCSVYFSSVAGWSDWISVNLLWHCPSLFTWLNFASWANDSKSTDQSSGHLCLQRSPICMW